jgi:hypothetical protein
MILKLQEIKIALNKLASKGDLEWRRFVRFAERNQLSVIMSAMHTIKPRKGGTLTFSG